MKRLLLLAVPLLGFCLDALADQTLHPLRISTPPTIDGDLSDKVWTTAPKVGHFVTFIPDFGKVQEQQTEVAMAYDKDNLYFAFWCYDDPSKIKTSLSARDNNRPDDWVCINLDTFGDQQGLYALYVNPSGTQSDSRFAGGSEDFSADMVWYSAGKLTDKGYQVEIQLPLKSFRYSDKDTVVMTVFFERYVSRLSEHGSYPALDPNKGYAFLSQMAPMVYTGLEHYTLFEILPAVVYNNQRAHQGGQLRTTDNKTEGSLTLKYGITSDLVLDGTYNPDFSQVEADAGQVDINLRTNLFYPEKRPFFLEGREYFAIGGSGNASPIQDLVHTRTIVDPIAGVKLTGKIGEQNIVSTIIARDAVPPVPGISTSDANFFIGRYRRTLSDDSFIGAIITDRESGGQYNRVGGVDGIVRISDDAQVSGHLIGSASRATGGSSQVNDHAVSAAYTMSNRDIGYGVNIVDVGRNFQTDVGYMVRNGVTSTLAYVRPSLYFDDPFFNKLIYGATAWVTRDQFSGLYEWSYSGLLQLLHRSNLTAQVQFTQSTEVFLNQRFNTSSVYAVWGGQVTKWLAVTTNYRTGKAIFYSLSPFQGSADRYFARFTFQPSENVAFEYSLTYAQFRGDTTSVSNFSYPINRAKFTYQLNRYIFFRAITEYNGYRHRMPTDLLASFTYIPGTVLHVGYGFVYNKREWDPLSLSYIPSQNFLQTNTGFFFKASYLWRL